MIVTRSCPGSICRRGVRVRTLRLITLAVLPLGFIVVAALALALILKSGQASRDILKDTVVIR